ncbi:Lead, cadmium, zinc and mercury transporting ATPase [Sinorhizobium alkalisoli]|nr:Lead, cadmium, zinc and mercury transporting ATPase [Sinorhizobium alkalisoli]
MAPWSRPCRRWSSGGLWQDWLYRSLALLLLACPCALVISTPAAIAASLSAVARRGLLIQGGAVLEKIAAADVGIAMGGGADVAQRHASDKTPCMSSFSRRKRAFSPVHIRAGLSAMMWRECKEFAI